MDNYYQYMLEAEGNVYLRNPVYEAEYMVEALDWPLSIYDGFTARLKEFYLHKKTYTAEHYLRKQALEKEQKDSLKS